LGASCCAGPSRPPIELFPGRGIRPAPHRLERFYEDPGSVGVGEPYLEDGLPHIEMLRAAP
jgi:ElaA protein